MSELFIELVFILCVCLFVLKCVYPVIMNLVQRVRPNHNVYTFNHHGFTGIFLFVYMFT